MKFIKEHKKLLALSAVGIIGLIVLIYRNKKESGLVVAPPARSSLVRSLFEIKA